MMKGNKHMKTITKFIYAAFAAVTLAMGAITANGATLFTSINGLTNENFQDQNFAGAIFQYAPTGTRIGGLQGLSRPRGVAFDSVGNFFVPTTFFTDTGVAQATILKVSGGIQITFATLSDNFYAEGVAIDGADNIFVFAIDTSDPNLASTIFKFTPDGTQSTFGSVVGQGFGLAFDSAGNLFATDAGAEGVNPTIWEFTPDGTRSVFVGPEAFPPEQGPVGLAFDQFGNLFVSTEPNGIPPPNGEGVIIKFAPDGTETLFAAVHDYARGLAFDRVGDLFVAEVGFINQVGRRFPGEILKFAPDGTRTVVASGIGNGNAGPEFLTFR
jgi:hypothetical protein